MADQILQISYIRQKDRGRITIVDDSINLVTLLETVDSLKGLVSIYFLLQPSKVG